MPPASGPISLQRFLPTGAQWCWPCYWFQSWTPKAQGKPTWGCLHLPGGGTYTGELLYLGWELLALRGSGEKKSRNHSCPFFPASPSQRDRETLQAASASNLLPPCLMPGGHSWRTGVLGSDCQWLSTSPEGRQSGVPMGSTQHHPEIDVLLNWTWIWSSL